MRVSDLGDDDVVEWPIDAAFLSERHDEVLVSHRLSASRREVRSRRGEPLWQATHSRCQYSLS